MVANSRPFYPPTARWEIAALEKRVAEAEGKLVRLLSPEVVEVAARAHYIELWGDDLAPGTRMDSIAMKQMRVALAAALAAIAESKS